MFCSIWNTPLCFYIRLRIEVDAVGDSDEHVAVGDAAVLGHTHADTAASGTGDEAASFPNLQGAALVVAYPDGWGSPLPWCAF